jgi:hypothetical protein
MIEVVSKPCLIIFSCYVYRLFSYTFLIHHSTIPLEFKHSPLG